MQSWRLLIKLSESVSTFRIVQKMWLQWPFFYTCTKRFGIEEVLRYALTCPQSAESSLDSGLVLSTDYMSKNAQDAIMLVDH